jgi:C-methyltransferase C-terminal domain/Methyltransferase domain
VAQAEGIPVCKEFFNLRVARRLVSMYGHGKIVHIHNCLAHCPDPPDVLQGLRELIGTGGMVIIETPAVLDLIENVRVDTIYHEHVSYFSFTSLVHALRAANLHPWHVEHTSNHGDSLLVYARATPSPDLEPIRKELDREAASLVGDPDRYRDFARHISDSGHALRSFLREALHRGQSTVLYGAAAKATTLLNGFAIDYPYVQFAVDRNPRKTGLRIPGTRLIIRHVEEMYRMNPDIVLIAAWNYADEIVRENEELVGPNTLFVTPLPCVKVVKCG